MIYGHTCYAWREHINGPLFYIGLFFLIFFCSYLHPGLIKKIYKKNYMYAQSHGDFLSKNVKSLGLTINLKEYPDNKKYNNKI